MNNDAANKLYTLSEACELLSISTATGRNWMKAGRLIPVSENGQKPLFEESSLFTLKKALADDSLPGLKSRRNKTYVSADTPVLDDITLCCKLRHCAEQLVLSAGYPDCTAYQPLLDDLVDSITFSKWKNASDDYDVPTYIYEPCEDTLGLLYQSLCNIGDKKFSGSYYTPAKLAKKLVDMHLPAISKQYTVLDPSCGTGVFLLQLPDLLPLQHIYGNDINPLSVTLTRINLALKYHVTAPEEIETLKHNITVSDFLSSVEEKKSIPPATSVFQRTYNIILGNPPWGAKLSAKEKKNYNKIFSCATGNSMEIFDLFIDQSLRLLHPHGQLAFVLPEAVLTVKSHTPVRKLLLTTTSLHSVEYLGEAFELVHCPSIILSVKKENTLPFFKNVAVTLSDGANFTTQVERIISADFFSFTLTDEEYLLLQKICSCPSCTTLVDNAVFALGIVTGNNAGLLHSASAPGLEPIIKGSDISKYHIGAARHYIKFQPDKLQQTAPEEHYRAPEKLFYRFINKQLIFAYDNTGLLSLNSCNIVIPQIPDLSVKYVLAVLNSTVAQFFFEKKFHSVKVLRSHIEQIPIPLADKVTQEEIVALVDILISLEESSSEYKKTFSALDILIASLYGLTTEEYKQISA